jgi:opacity protein-like surface antigen
MRNIIVLCFLFASFAFAQGRVAVLPSIVNDEESKITPKELQHLDNEIKTIAEKSLAGKNFHIVSDDEVIEAYGDASTFHADCAAGGSCMSEVVVNKVKADFGARLNIYTVHKQMYMRFELYGKKTGAKSINPPVKNYAEILNIVKKEVPAMFLNITLSEREICESILKKMWIDDDCKSELDIEKDRCDKRKDEGYIWKDNKVCVHRDQLTCKGTWIEIEERCKSEAETKCEKEAGKAWLNGKCVSQTEQACKDLGKNSGEEFIWENNVCKPKKQRDCELQGKEWVGNACKDKGQAECEHKGYTWLGNGRCVAPVVAAPASDSYTEYSSSSYTEYSTPSYTYSSSSTSYVNTPQRAASQPAERYGVRVSIGLNSFSFGYEVDSELDMGYSFGIGVIFSIPIMPNFTFNPEAHFLYRTLYSSSYSESGGGGWENDDGGWEVNGINKFFSNSDVSEFAIGGSLLVQYAPIAEMPFYITAGLQIDIPFSTETNYEGSLQGGSKNFEDRRMFDFGLALGAGYNVTENIRADLRAVIGLTSLTERDEDKSSFNQYGLGVAYFF